MTQFPLVDGASLAAASHHPGRGWFFSTPGRPAVPLPGA
jgi:hypothetical protein